MEMEKHLDPDDEYYSPEPSDNETERDKLKSSQRELVDREVKDVFEEEEEEEDEDEDENEDEKNDNNKNQQEDRYSLDEEMSDNDDSYSEEEPVLTVTLEELSSSAIDSDIRTLPVDVPIESTASTTTTVIERNGDVETHVTTVIEEVNMIHDSNENEDANIDTDEEKTSSVISISVADMQVAFIDEDNRNNESISNSSDFSSEMVDVVEEHKDELLTASKQETVPVTNTVAVSETITTDMITQFEEELPVMTTSVITESFVVDESTAGTITQLEEESLIMTTSVTTESIVVDETTAGTIMRSGRKPLTIITSSTLANTESLTVGESMNDTDNDTAIPVMPRSPRIHPKSLATAVAPSSLSGEDSFVLNNDSTLSPSSPPPIIVDSVDNSAISVPLPRSPHIQPNVLATENRSTSEIADDEEQIKEQVVVEEQEQEQQIVHEEHFISTPSPPNVSNTANQEHLLPRSPRIRPIAAHTNTFGDTRDESYQEDIDEDELSLDGTSMMLPPSPLMEPSMFQYPVDTTLVSAPYIMTTATTATVNPTAATTTTTTNMLITEQPGAISMSIHNNHVSSNEYHLSDASPLPSVSTKSPSLMPVGHSSYISSVSDIFIQILNMSK
jgi:hypothetical protein